MEVRWRQIPSFWIYSSLNIWKRCCNVWISRCSVRMMIFWAILENCKNCTSISHLSTLKLAIECCKQFCFWYMNKQACGFYTQKSHFYHVIWKCRKNSPKFKNVNMTFETIACTINWLFELDFFCKSKDNQI